MLIFFKCGCPLRLNNIREEFYPSRKYYFSLLFLLRNYRPSSMLATEIGIEHFQKLVSVSFFMLCQLNYAVFCQLKLHSLSFQAPLVQLFLTIKRSYGLIFAFFLGLRRCSFIGKTVRLHVRNLLLFQKKLLSLESISKDRIFQKQN